MKKFHQPPHLTFIPQSPNPKNSSYSINIKLPILKMGEYDIWAMKMEHYLAHTDYPIWEVIQNGNGPVSITTDTQGQIKVLPPRTAEEIVARERERKARTTFLMLYQQDAEAISCSNSLKAFYVSKTSEGLHKGYDRFQIFLGDCKALVTIDEEGVDWTNHSEKDEDYALMACNSSESDTEAPHDGNQGITLLEFKTLMVAMLLLENKVLFTDSECLVLSPEFKLPDENQVLLKIPRQNNMYSFNLENIVPSGGLACLIAKATTNESNKWHRRLGHVNFKNLNKLVKGNLGILKKKMNLLKTALYCQYGLLIPSTITPDLKRHEKREGPREEEQAFFDELERLKRQEKEANMEAEALRKEFAQETENLVIQRQGGDKGGCYGLMADFTNLETVVNVSPIPTSRIISSHPSALILGDPTSSVQTRSKVNKSFGAHAFVSYVQKQRRNNHKDSQHCLFACFLSQNEPKKISEALEDESWVDAMQEELMQFKIQKLWILVDLPFRKKAIGTKWVYRNKIRMRDDLLSEI
ncbi:putative ribonuclease H-like domain-containing protein [Tanacetum coccineum]